MTTTSDKLAIRRRLFEDFEFYAKHCCKIRTKEGQISPLILNPVQKRFLEVVLRQLTTRGRVRMVVLKARQQGLSTVISALQYWWLSQRKAQKGLVMAHESDSTTALLDMYRRLHDNAPEWVRPSTKYASRNELVFDRLDSGLRVATAGGRGVARGETLTFAHLSEVAFWPTAFAANNFNGLIQAVPETDGTFVFVESTAQGVTGKFYELWNNSVAMGYEPFFSGWYESAEYCETAPADLIRTPDEESIAAQYELTNDQLYWRRRKIAANGTDLFRQEYPATPEEAFVTSGRPVFNTDYVMERLRTPKEPLKRMAVDSGVLNDNPRGELLVYREFDDKDAYVIGADVGMGGVNGRDFSVAQILDSKLRQVALWRGIVHPDAFAKVLLALGYFYNSAMICVERNNHGLLTCVRLRDLGYYNLWTDMTEGTLEDRDSINIGFFTSEKTKPLVIDKLRAVDRDREIEINDPTTLREMMSYVVTESGRMDPEDGAHDDCVISLALANHIHDGKWEPIKVTDEFYCKAI
jgi:hypothetical protein